MKARDVSEEILKGRPIICDKWVARGDAYLMADALIVRTVDDELNEINGIPVVLDYQNLRLREEHGGWTLSDGDNEIGRILPPIPSAWMAL